eukprot:scaffold12599_cov62-Isochrysis_galbana.AAC.1
MSLFGKHKASMRPAGAGASAAGASTAGAASGDSPGASSSDGSPDVASDSSGSGETSATEADAQTAVDRAGEAGVDASLVEALVESVNAGVLSFDQVIQKLDALIKALPRTPAGAAGGRTPPTTEAGATEAQAAVDEAISAGVPTKEVSAVVDLVNTGRVSFGAAVA